MARSASAAPAACGASSAAVAAAGRGQDEAFGLERRATVERDRPAACAPLDPRRARHATSRPERRAERARQLAETFGERDGTTEPARPARAKHAPQDAAVLALERGEARQRRPHRQRGRVAGVDADERGSRRALGSLGPEPARHEVEHRFVVVAVGVYSASDERLAQEPQLAARAEEVRLDQRGRAGGKRPQLAGDVDRAAARGGQGADDPGLETGAGDERRDRLGPVEHRLRPALAQKSVDARAGDEPARLGRVIDQRHVVPGADQQVRGGQPGDAAADDRDAHA